MPKLLDFIKNMELSHEDVMAILKDYEAAQETESEEEEVVEEEEIVEEDDQQSDIDENEEEESEQEPEVIQISKTELNKLIKSAIEDTLKANRKAPSKGKPVKVPSQKNIIKKNWFEVIV